jgi:dihydrofolate reductase
MSRLIMWNLVTLDGFFEGAKSWDLGWHEYVWGEELESISLEQLRSADRLLFGRVTYEGWLHTGRQPRAMSPGS